MVLKRLQTQCSSDQMTFAGGSYSPAHGREYLVSEVTQQTYPQAFSLRRPEGSKKLMACSVFRAEPGTAVNGLAPQLGAGARTAGWEGTSLRSANKFQRETVAQYAFHIRLSMESTSYARLSRCKTFQVGIGFCVLGMATVDRLNNPRTTMNLGVPSRRPARRASSNSPSS